MANGFGGGFGGNMGGFTLPDFTQPDLSGIGAAVAKYQADEARKGATNQYEADVAEFKTNEAKGLEQGLGSLEQAPLPFDLEPQMIQEILPQLPPEIIQEVVPQLPPEIIPAVVPQLPPENITRSSAPVATRNITRSSAPVATRNNSCGDSSVTTSDNARYY